VRRLLLLAATLGVLAAPPAQAASAHTIRFIVLPTTIHIGDTVYLSGSGFPHRRQITVVAQCSPPAGQPFTVGAAGPTSNGAGQFVGVPFHLPPVPASDLLGCLLTPTSGSFQGPVASVGVFPGSASLPPNQYPYNGWWVTHHHTRWGIAVSLWPGSHLDLRATYLPGPTVQYKKLTAPTLGTVKVSGPPGDRRWTGVRVTIHASFRGYSYSVTNCVPLPPTRTHGSPCHS
jgi:hypothetical protein